MDPNVQEAEEKLQQAEQIETTAAGVDGDAAAELEITASNLRTEAEQEKANAEAQAEQEKRAVDEKYGTS